MDETIRGSPNPNAIATELKRRTFFFVVKQGAGGVQRVRGFLSPTKRDLGNNVFFFVSKLNNLLKYFKIGTRF